MFHRKQQPGELTRRMKALNDGLHCKRTCEAKREVFVKREPIKLTVEQERDLLNFFLWQRVDELCEGSEVVN